MKKSIPNFFTFLNLTLGILGLTIILEMSPDQVNSGGLYLVSMLIFAASICDFLDGFFAKLFKAHSGIGKELDSFADFITFGVLPSFILYRLLEINNCELSLLRIPTILMPSFVAYRLARFNTSPSTSYFTGLSSTANGIFVSILPFIQKFPTQTWLKDILLDNVALFLTTITLCILMVSNVRFLSLKLTSWHWKDNKTWSIIVILSILFISILKIEGAFLSFITYIIASIILNFFSSSKD